MDLFSLISGGLGFLGGVAGGIAGGIQSAREAREAKKMQEERDLYNKAMYERSYYEDALSRNDTQHMLRNLRDEMQDAVEQQQVGAVMGGATPEAVAAAKEANARAYADAIAGIDATNSQRRDAARAQYAAVKNQSYADWIGLHSNQSSNWTNFAGQALAIGAKSIDTIGSAFDKEEK